MLIDPLDIGTQDRRAWSLPARPAPHQGRP